MPAFPLLQEGEWNRCGNRSAASLSTAGRSAPLALAGFGPTVPPIGPPHSRERISRETRARAEAGPAQRFPSGLGAPEGLWEL